MIRKCYAEAHNNFLKFYDADKSTLYIIYVDAKNLHGNSVMQLLPTELFDWANIKGSKVIKEILSKDEVQIIENNNFSLGKNNFFLI